MVTEALFAVVMGLATWVMESVPFPSFPVELASISSGLDYLGDALGVVGFWLPLPLVVIVLTAYLAVHAAAVLVKLGRQALSYLTLGGGAT